jgi:hypothetical protein
MEAMDTLKPEIARLFAAKEARRHKLAVQVAVIFNDENAHVTAPAAL